MTQAMPLLETASARLGDYLVATLGPAYLSDNKVFHPVEITFAQNLDRPAFAVALRLPGEAAVAAVFGPCPRYGLAREAVDVALLHYDPTWLVNHLAATSHRRTDATTRAMIRDIIGPIRHSTAPTWSEHVSPNVINAAHALIRAAALRQNRGY
jgi:hypothetical protein